GFGRFRRLALREYPTDCGRESFGVMMKIDPNIQSQTVPESQSFNVLWKFFRSRHLGVADQDWNNRELALQGVTDFEPHKIIGFVNTPTLVFALAYPIRSNNRHQNLRATDYLFDVIAKIDAYGIESKSMKTLPRPNSA